MRRQTLVGSVFSSILSASILIPSLHAAVQPRINTAVNDQARVSLADTVAPRAKAATDLGAAPANQVLSSVTLRFSMTAAQSAALDQLLADQQNPSSPRYRQWLTPEQFAAQFGLAASDLAQVKTWLASKGLTITSTARSGTFVTVSGSVAQINAAFGTQLHSLSLKGETHFGNLSEPTLPAAIAGVVGGITGLNDFKLKSRARIQHPAADPAKPLFTSSISGSHFIAPGDFYTIYDVNPLLNSSINGKGITIAVMGQTDISLTDAAAFRSASGLTANAPTVKLYGTDPGTSSDDIDEAMLDVEWSGAVAPAASILFVNSTDVIGISMTQAIDNALAPIITVSYGDCEANWGSSYLNIYNQLFKQANVQGQTIVGPAGDSGATDCDYDATTAVNGLAVDFPASSPYVTGLGGTMFNEGSATGATSYWSGTNGTTGGSATGYIPEAVWNETAADTVLLGYTSTFAAGGGGASAFFTKPAYQVGTGVPSDSSRDVPDVSLNAAASHDGYLFCSQGLCTNGFRNAAGNLDVVGGTSVATPSFAALLALVEQKTATKIANANPYIYALANSTYYGNVFHDVTVGNNSNPCTAGTVNCPGGGSIGYNATAGYDLATGWGSVDATNLVNYWSQIVPIGTSTTGANLSTVTLTESAFNVVAGVAISLNATVAAASSGTTPTGTVQFLVDNVATGSAVTLASGIATYTLATASLTTGLHNVTAAYSGDTNYTGSKATTQIDITSATAADFTLSPTAATITVKSGATATPLAITVAPLHGFTGSVAFTASSTSSTLYATYAFSTTPVVISSTANGTTNFTLYAYASSSTTGQAKFGPVQSASNAPAMPAWYAAGSGISVAGLLLLTLPRRRKWSALLLAVLSVGVLGASGCSSGTILSSGGSTGGTTTSTVNTTPGTYNVTVTAYCTPTGGTPIAHDINITFVVQ
ncbi:Ig-like domain (group 3) [Granulicella rosea]|uniref:Ig-like domain (Group 3) n=1 Tax=Granulicella rosea TaxID=474952 RepID=A0A239H630_9BACT|nr:protease pro-enzyme activation domain-containing protein [Granulicella rosea]SNS76896.1 Ig-like domain (group 3) [Granulicella rosea]